MHTRARGKHVRAAAPVLCCCRAGTQQLVAQLLLYAGFARAFEAGRDKQRVAAALQVPVRHSGAGARAHAARGIACCAAAAAADARARATTCAPPQEEALVVFQPESRPMLPAHLLVAHHPLRQLLLVVRGTSGVADVLTDIVAHASPLGQGVRALRER